MHPRWTSVLALLLVAGPAYGWNSTGHEIVAQIAWDHLSPTTRQSIAALLRQHPRRDQDLLKHLKPGQDPDRVLFLAAATWPDLVKNRTNSDFHTENHPTWHYVDFPIDRDGHHGPVPQETRDRHSDPQNVLQAMAKCTREMKDPNTPADRKAIDLCWIEHLVGDLHQPLHTVSLFSDGFPDGDRGGNLIRVRTSTGKETNLHAFWDNVEGLSTNPNRIRKVADRIEREHPQSEFQDELKRADVKDWARESAQLAWPKVYLNGLLPMVPAITTAAPPTPALPAGYERDAHAVADRQIALAGYSGPRFHGEHQGRRRCLHPAHRQSEAQSKRTKASRRKPPQCFRAPLIVYAFGSFAITASISEATKARMVQPPHYRWILLAVGVASFYNSDGRRAPGGYAVHHLRP